MQTPRAVRKMAFPSLCPASLPAAVVEEFYEETITFFMPAEVVDPGSGITADLNSVTVTAITGVPLGMQVELDDDDAVYYPTGGQTLGCANICGSPLLAGSFEMVINISAVASAFGIEQVVTESFPYLLTVEAGKAEMRRSVFSSHRLRLPRRQFRSIPIGQRQSNQRIQLGFRQWNHKLGSGD